MFVTVKYGEDESRLFNINCRNEVLLYQIKKRCKMDRDEVIDLSDEQGVVKNLRQNLDEYGYEYLKERETVILLRVDSCVPEGVEDVDSMSDKTIFIPMLTAMTDNQDFIAKLNGQNHQKGYTRRRSVRKHALNPKDSGSKSSLLDDVDGKGKRSKAKDKKKDKKPSTTKPVTVKK